MNHYCSYFDATFLEKGLALWLSLRRHDPGAVLWVLALDETVADALRRLGKADLRIVPLAELEAADPELAGVKSTRSKLEYFFTLSPCWPRWLLRRQTEIERITYVDADMAFFSSPLPLLEELGGNNVLIVEHRHPEFLRRDGWDVRFGRFNVGVLCFHRSAEGMRCLDWWRERCLEWCYDRVENAKFADQKYLDEWPALFAGVVVCRHPGVNLAPWNWMSHRCTITEEGMLVDGRPLIAYHFALFRPMGRFLFDSGQLNFGIMPLGVRSWLHGRYFALLEEARRKMEAIGIEAPCYRPRTSRRGGLGLLKFIFGSLWLRAGPVWISGRFGLGRFSGRILARTRRLTNENR